MPQSRHRFALPAYVLAALLALGACAPTDYFLLPQGGPAAAGRVAAPASRSPISACRPMPDALEIASLQPAGEVRLAKASLWADTPRRALTLHLVSALRDRLTGPVGTEPWPGFEGAGLRVAVTVERMIGARGPLVSRSVRDRHGRRRVRAADRFRDHRAVPRAGLCRADGRPCPRHRPPADRIAAASAAPRHQLSPGSRRTRIDLPEDRVNENMIVTAIAMTWLDSRACDSHGWVNPPPESAAGAPGPRAMRQPGSSADGEGHDICRSRRTGTSRYIDLAELGDVGHAQHRRPASYPDQRDEVVCRAAAGRVRIAWGKGHVPETLPAPSPSALAASICPGSTDWDPGAEHLGGKAE